MSRLLTSDQSNFLQQQGFSSGLAQYFAQCVERVPLRWWLVDNSSSMSNRDAHVISGSIDQILMLDGTRWEEVRSCVIYHAHVAGLFQLPTRFTLLNSTDPYRPQIFCIAERGASSIQHEVQFMDQTLRSSYPFGGTPLTRHLLNIRPIIADMAPRLWQEGRKATIVLATDGLPSTDHDENNVQIQDFIQALKSFENLPVWIVIRLCTDDEKVFDFYNSLDVHVSLALDVLDDLVGEALEVYLRNPWLTYGLPIHRVRELGFPHAVMDAIDEHMLSYHELQVFCSLLFANQVFPDPAQDWTNFLRCVAHAVSTERLQWNPVTKCPSPWIDIVRLNTIYGRNQPLPREFLYPTSVAGNTSLPSTGMTTSSAIHLGQHKHAVPISPSAVSGQQPPSLNPLFTIPDKGAPTSASYSQPAPSRHSFDRHEGPQYQQSRGSPYPQQQQRHQHHQQQQSRVTPSVPLTEPEYSADHHLSVIKKQLMQQWGLQPPSFKSLRPIDQLLNSVHHALPPAFGVASHSYFLKFKPFSPEALGSQNSAVIQRAMRKIKFLLHPDKLPKDFTPEQYLICREIWDILAEASDSFESCSKP